MKPANTDKLEGIRNGRRTTHTPSLGSDRDGMGRGFRGRGPEDVASWK